MIRFIADQWVTLDRDPFEDDVTLHPSAEDEELDRGYMFKWALNEALKGHHIWWSIFSKPLRSR